MDINSIMLKRAVKLKQEMDQTLVFRRQIRSSSSVHPGVFADVTAGVKPVQAPDVNCLKVIQRPPPKYFYCI